MQTTLRLGDWVAICDVCGFKKHASELRRRWDGMMVCEDDFEERHPQDFVKATVDRQRVPWVRPPATDTFQTVKFVDITDLVGP